MTKNGFLGSCVDAHKMVDDKWKNYQDVFYKHFTWGVLENALKWLWMEEFEVRFMLFLCYFSIHENRYCIEQ